MGLLRFIFWFFFIYYVLKLLTRIFAPILLKRFTNKMQDRFKEQFNQQYEYSKDPVQPEGKTTLKRTKPSTKSKSDGVGDYVDFEEVEE
jgi:hypothetical protein